MTTGSLWKNILLFSLPLMMTQVLEVLFNLSDVAIAGKFADYIALGAVGSTTLLVSLFTGFLIGMGAGVNVRAAHRLGAGDDEGVRMTVHSSLLVCGIIGVIVCLVCLFLAEPMLTLLRTKSELITEAVTYLRIYSLGMPAMAVYNFGSGILSACGETKRLRRDQAPADIPLDSRSAQCCAEPFLRHLLRNGGFRSRGGERYLAVPFGGADSGTPRAPQGLLRAQTLPEVHQP